MKYKKIKHAACIGVLLFVLLPSFVHAIGVKRADCREKLDYATQRKFDYFFYEGEKLKNAGKYDAAFDMFSYCLEMDSTSSAALFELSMFYIQRNRPQTAVEMLKKAVAHDGGNFTYRMTLAGLYRNLGMYGEASSAYEEVVKQHPEKSELNYYLADALTQEGEIGKAIDAYDALESSLGMSEMLSLQKYKLYQSIN